MPLSPSPSETLLNELTDLRSQLAGLPEVRQADGAPVRPDSMSLRIWRLPEWYDRARRTNQLIATGVDVVAMATRRRMIRVADVRSPDLGPGSGIKWQVGKGIQGAMANAERQRQGDPPVFESVVHKVDLAPGTTSPAALERRRELKLTPADVQRLVDTYGSAVAVPIWRRDLPFGSICLDSCAGVELGAHALETIVNELLVFERPLAQLLQTEYQDVRDAVRIC